MIHTLDSRDLQKELEQLEDDLESITAEWQDLVDELAEMREDEEVSLGEEREMEEKIKAKEEEIEDWKGDNQERLDDLKQLFTSIDDDCTLVREDSFEEYVQELTEDIAGDIPSWLVIDWEATARDVQMDYTAVEFDGETWLVR